MSRTCWLKDIEKLMWHGNKFTFDKQVDWTRLRYEVLMWVVMDWIWKIMIETIENKFLTCESFLYISSS